MYFVGNSSKQAYNYAWKKNSLILKRKFINLNQTLFKNPCDEGHHVIIAKSI